MRSPVSQQRSGNDTGADTFAAYLKFRAAHPAIEVHTFIDEELASRQLADVDWYLLKETDLETALNTDRGYTVLQRDDLIIGLAFAQLLIDGQLDADVRKRAIAALRRQGTDAVLAFRGGGREDARKKQMIGYQQILEAVSSCREYPFPP